MNVIQLRMELLAPGAPSDANVAAAPGAMSGMTSRVGGGFFAGVAPDHRAALLAPLLLPLLIWIFMAVVDLAVRANLPGAERFQRGLAGAPALTRAIVFLLALAGTIHLALVPGHLAEDGSLAALFALNGVAFVAVGIAAFVWRRWRSVAATLLGITLLAYLDYLGAGREDPDVVGTVTYLVELVTLGLVWIPRDPSADASRADANRGALERAARTTDRDGVIGVGERS